MDNNIPEQYQKRPSDLDKRMAKRYNSDGKYIKTSNQSKDIGFFGYVYMFIMFPLLLVGFMYILVFLFG